MEINNPAPEKDHTNAGGFTGFHLFHFISWLSRLVFFGIIVERFELLKLLILRLFNFVDGIEQKSFF